MDAQESQIYTALLIAIVIIGNIIAYFIFSVINQHKKVLTLQRKNLTAEITALENDRSRIAADLHDDLAPMLSAVKMRINSFEITDPQDQVQLEKTNQAIDEIARRMREISFDLMPNTLQRKGLLVALQEYVGYINRKDSLQVRLSLPEEPLYLEEQKSINVYRIVQEIVHNTLKHAQATELILEVKKEREGLVLFFKDNGRGFNYREELKDTTGFGLRSLLNRTHLLQGDLEVQSKEGKGTAYIIQIPLKNE